MPGLIIAAELEIPRPDTTSGWLFLVFGIVLAAFLINEGFYQLVRKTYPELKKTLLFAFALVVVGVLAANEAGWGQDPVVQVDVLPTEGSAETPPLAGATASNDGTSP